MGGGILYYFLVDVISALRKGQITILFNGKWLDYLNCYWFLWSVLAASIVVIFAFNHKNKRIETYLWLLAGIAIVAMFPGAQNNIYMYPYFVVGYLVNQFSKREILKTVMKYRWGSLPLYGIMLLFFNRNTYIYTSGLLGQEGVIQHMPTNLFRWCIGFVGALVAFTVSYRAFGKKNRISKLFYMLGRKSLQVYMLSCIFLSRYLPAIYSRMVSAIGRNIFASNLFLYDCVYTVLLAALFSVVLYGLTIIFEKLRISVWVFGR